MDVALLTQYKPLFKSAATQEEPRSAGRITPYLCGKMCRGQTRLLRRTEIPMRSCVPLVSNRFCLL